MDNSILIGAGGGLLGGFVAFLLGLKANRYQNNKYWIKCGIEVAGGAITAAMVGQVLGFDQAKFLVATFAIGTMWATIVQNLREWVTRVVKAAIGGKS